MERRLVGIQLEVLFTRTADGRLIATRDPSPRPAPRVFLGRSAEGNAWAVHRDVDPRTRAELERLLSAEPRLPEAGFGQGPRCGARVRELLSPVVAEHRGPAYVLGDELPRDDRARQITVDERFEWRVEFPWLAEEFEAVAPVAIAFESGRPAAICHSPRGLTAAGAAGPRLEPPPAGGRLPVVDDAAAAGRHLAVRGQPRRASIRETAGEGR